MSNKTQILVIEDDPNLRELYQEVLTQNGYDVTIAEDGELGLAKLRKGGYELVLLDMMLPKLNGLEILKQFKTHGVAKGKPANGQVVLMTNLSEESLLSQAEALGSVTHFIKSEITPSILIEKIKALLIAT